MTACKIKHLAVRWLLLHYKNLGLKSWGFKKKLEIFTKHSPLLTSNIWVVQNCLIAFHIDHAFCSKIDF